MKKNKKIKWKIHFLTSSISALMFSIFIFQQNGYFNKKVNNIVSINNIEKEAPSIISIHKQGKILSQGQVNIASASELKAGTKGIYNLSKIINEQDLNDFSITLDFFKHENIKQPVVLADTNFKDTLDYNKVIICDNINTSLVNSLSSITKVSCNIESTESGELKITVPSFPLLQRGYYRFW